MPRAEFMPGGKRDTSVLRVDRYTPLPANSVPGAIETLLSIQKAEIAILGNLFGTILESLLGMLKQLYTIQEKYLGEAEEENKKVASQHFVMKARTILPLYTTSTCLEHDL
ncbi:hypothetical protein M8J76_013451 [Diaphorina citri]|nr:hypothetical protein M8J75_015478 [Diaphorina citri]KAI5745689.1 hypothetical protein M8J76_013451 [Diaphorina citri]